MGGIDHNRRNNAGLLHIVTVHSDNSDNHNGPDQPMNQIRARQPRLIDPNFLAFIRTKPCTCCGRHPPSEAAHIRIGLFARGMKPHDKHAVPLCAWCHRDGPEAQHKMNETEFWEMWEIDPFDVAAKLYSEYGGTGGAPRRPRKVRPRKPKAQRQKITSRGFGKQKRTFGQ